MPFHQTLLPFIVHRTSSPRLLAHPRLPLCPNHPSNLNATVPVHALTAKPQIRARPTPTLSITSRRHQAQTLHGPPRTLPPITLTLRPTRRRLPPTPSSLVVTQSTLRSLDPPRRRSHHPTLHRSDTARRTGVWARSQTSRPSLKRTTSLTHWDGPSRATLPPTRRALASLTGSISPAKGSLHEQTPVDQRTWSRRRRAIASTFISTTISFRLRRPSPTSPTVLRLAATTFHNRHYLEPLRPARSDLGPSHQRCPAGQNAPPSLPTPSPPWLAPLRRRCFRSATTTTRAG